MCLLTKPPRSTHSSCWCLIQHVKGILIMALMSADQKRSSMKNKARPPISQHWIRRTHKSQLFREQERAKCRHWLTRKHASRTNKSEHLIHLIIWILRTRLGFPGQGIAGSTVIILFSRTKKIKSEMLGHQREKCCVWWLKYNEKIRGKYWKQKDADREKRESELWTKQWVKRKLLSCDVLSYSDAWKLRKPFTQAHKSFYKKMVIEE